jgi:hypothetical protein
MKCTNKDLHPEGEGRRPIETDENQPIEVDTFDGKVFVSWDPDASVTAMGQLPFFIEFLKLGNRFQPWVDDCPLAYTSNNAPGKNNLLGSLFLSILAGHTRYAHLRSLMGDTVSQQLLGMTKIVGDDSARRGLKKIEETQGIHWLEKHLQLSYEPLLTTPWILDADVTVKCLYGNQEGAVVGYNPKKPGRPSHCYHTYLIANLRLVLNIEVLPGDESHSSHSLPGLLDLLDRLPKDSKPEFIRGDCDFGSNQIMRELEERRQGYLFKLKKSKRVKDLILQHHCKRQWQQFSCGLEAKESTLQLMGWNQARRVLIVRKRVVTESIAGVELEDNGQQRLAFIDEPEDLKAYQYAVLVTNLDCDITALIQHYRDRADCENVFDEVKNQWGWGGFTTRDLKSCRFISRMIALIYNWWTLFARLANPDNHLEAVTSKPLLLNGVGKLTSSGRQKRMVITHHHNDAKKVKKICLRITHFFQKIKATAPQLSSLEKWKLILAEALSAFKLGKPPDIIKCLPAPG